MRNEELVIDDSCGLADFVFLEGGSLQLNIFSIPLPPKDNKDSFEQEIVFEGAVIECRDFAFKKGDVKQIFDALLEENDRDAQKNVQIHFSEGYLKVYFDRVTIKKSKLYMT